MKRIRKNRRIAFDLWISFLLLAGISVILFWVILSTSLRVNYSSENEENLLQAAWTAVGEYGDEEFESNLKYVAESENYFIQIVRESDQSLLLALDVNGETDAVQAEGIIPENLFALLDETDGSITYYVEDVSRDVEWVVSATVVAYRDGSREVLVISKSLANVDALILSLRKWVFFALLLVLIISSVLALLIARKISAPITRLTKKAQKMAGGDYKLAFEQEGNYEVRQLSSTLEMAAREFEATEEMRREFFANISHDMKTPLTVIKMYAEMIQTVSGDNPAKREAHLERIVSEAERLTVFINDSMDLAKLQSRTMEVHRESFDAAVLIRETTEFFSVHQEQEGFEIRVSVQEPLPVFADRKLIGRVIENFISNALKFSIGQKQIDVEALHVEDGVKVSVRDYGSGIKPEDLPHVWERYYKVDPYGTNKTGTGIGLHIVHEILEIHEAQYGVDSEWGQGSCFWFVLPDTEKGSI